MKIVPVLMALMVSFVLGFSNVSDVYAVTAAKEGVEQKTVVKQTRKSTPQNIDINLANREQLMQLPGIGSKTAAAILKYRQGIGKFKSLDELTNVKGIGEKTLLKLEPFLKKV